MANMSYCLFRNTLSDLRDCYEMMGETPSDDERRAYEALITLCKKIAAEYGDIAP